MKNKLKGVVINLKESIDIGIISDVILHQVSIDNEWIFNQTEAGFNLNNTPELIVSYELEKVI